jgi:hypothetical protein
MHIVVDLPIVQLVLSLLFAVSSVIVGMSDSMMV